MVSERRGAYNPGPRMRLAFLENPSALSRPSRFPPGRRAGGVLFLEDADRRVA